MYEVEEYTTNDGKSPLRKWLHSLKDKRAQAKLFIRLDRVYLGNFGDWKDIKGAKGIFEMREHYGPGYRIFYTVVSKKVVLLLAGSCKNDQERTIAKAKEY